MTPIRRVQSLVAQAYGISVPVLLAKDRHKTVAEARMLAMYLCRTALFPRPSFPELGKAFEDRDHTTVMSACQKTAERLKDPYFAARTAVVRGAVTNMDTTPIEHLPLARGPIELAPDWVGTGTAGE